jgi:hypothetical protein
MVGIGHGPSLFLNIFLNIVYKLLYIWVKIIKNIGFLFLSYLVRM